MLYYFDGGILHQGNLRPDTYWNTEKIGRGRDLRPNLGSYRCHAQNVKHNISVIAGYMRGNCIRRLVYWGDPACRPSNMG